MTSMAPLLDHKFCSPSSPTSFWRRTAAPKTTSRTRSRLKALEKIQPQLSQPASSRQAAASNSGVGARNKYRPAMTAAFKSP